MIDDIALPLPLGPSKPSDGASRPARNEARVLAQQGTRLADSNPCPLR